MKRSLYVALAVVFLGATVGYATQGSNSSNAADVEAIRALIKKTERGNYDRDVKAATAMYERAGERLLVYDMVPPLEDRGFQKAAWNKVKAFFDGTVGPIIVEYIDPKITVDGDHAYVMAHLHFAFTMKDGKKADVTGRVTDIYERIGGEWTVVHEHSSVPTTVGFTWGEE